MGVEKTTSLEIWWIRQKCGPTDVLKSLSYSSPFLSYVHRTKLIAHIASENKKGETRDSSPESFNRLTKHYFIFNKVGSLRSLRSMCVGLGKFSSALPPDAFQATYHQRTPHCSWKTALVLDIWQWKRTRLKPIAMKWDHISWNCFFVPNCALTHQYRRVPALKFARMHVVRSYMSRHSLSSSSLLLAVSCRLRFHNFRSLDQ